MPMANPTSPDNAELAARIEELASCVMKIEGRLEQLSLQVAQLAAFSANIQESLKVMGVTDGYAPPKEKQAGCDPAVG